MCLEFAFKKGGISLIRNFFHQAEAIQKGLPYQVADRLAIRYRLRTFAQGKVVSSVFIEDPIAGFQGKGDTK